MVALENIDVHADEHVPRAAQGPQVVIHCQMRAKLHAVDMLEPSKRGRPRVDESIKVVRKKTSKKNYNGKMTTLQITKETREKLRVFQDRHKLKSMDHVLQELLKFYPDTGVRTPRNRSVVIPDKSNSDTEPEHNNESLFRMAIIGRLVSELGVSHYMVPLCLAYCDMY